MKIARLLPWLLLAGALVIIGLDYRATSILRSENDGLKATLQAREAAVNEHAGTMEARDAELARLRAEVEQLPKLRGELTRLRNSTGEVAELQRGLQRLAADNLRLQTAPATAAAVPQPGATPGYMPREQWAFAGYATPAASLQSILWSMSQGDLKTLFAGMTPEMKALGDKDWVNKTEQQIADEMKRESQKLAGFQVLKSEVTEDGATTITVFMDGENKSQKIKFRQLGEEWKMAPR